tara:strand:- start:346 stop:606 length:261 start_codon:yes stop_codon:yes gene_type:complete
MTRPAKFAFKALIEMGVPVLRHPSQPEHFVISAEDNPDHVMWADYYGAMGLDTHDFGVHKSITEVLTRHDLFAEWENPGMLNVWDA